MELNEAPNILAQFWKISKTYPLATATKVNVRISIPLYV